MQKNNLKPGAALSVLARRKRHENDNALQRFAGRAAETKIRRSSR
jgi:hypothetical protein